MEIFKGNLPMIDCCSVSFSVCTDACKIAGGAFHQGDFVYKAWCALPINYLEALALEPAVRRWAHFGEIRKCLFIQTMLLRVPS